MAQALLGGVSEASVIHDDGCVSAIAIAVVIDGGWVEGALHAREGEVELGLIR